ncbi:MAG TPA: AAA family ATPase [Lentisphaeria bacterium]|nr:MAG: hypothetical protein A2X47_01950 [Lentisphaerae bacterium GWF2_38_69]HBM16801.1 AAA family ATPase [Lentisphaeria bacterium]
MWIERQIKEKIAKSAKSRPVILLTGARQTGKSSLLMKTFPEYSYTTLDKISIAAEAESNPDLFLKKLKLPAIIDEIQYAPMLFRHLKILIDENRQKYGNWIISGSQKFSLMKKASESLAGRIQIFNLESFSAKELRSSGQFSDSQIKEILWKGGYPELWANPDLSASDYFEGYIQTYLEKDLKELINVSSLKDFQRFLRICTLRAGQLVNYTQIARDVGVSNNTIKNWISALEAGGIIYLLPPFFDNIGKRFIKAPKLYFADSGLLCQLMNVSNLNAWESYANRGQLWENFVFNELVKSSGLLPGKNLFFYRDQNAVEIDFLVELNDKLYLMEAKASEFSENKKLNFAKVSSALGDRDIESVLFSMTEEKEAVKINNYNVINPLYTDIMI